MKLIDHPVVINMTTKILGLVRASNGERNPLKHKISCSLHLILRNPYPAIYN